MRMLAFARSRRLAAIVGGWLCCGAFAAAASAEDPCPNDNPCMPAARPPGEARLNPPLLRAEGGGRAPGWPRALPATSAVDRSEALSRHELELGRIDPDHEDGYLYRLPYADDVSFPVIQAYGAKLSHRGAEQFAVDFGMPIGTPVHAARDGVVVLLEDSHDVGCWREECSRLANFVVVLHSDGTTGEYFHLQRNSAHVRIGDRVQRGQLLAHSGNTGYSTAPHLHFGVYRTQRDGRTQSLAVRFQTRVGALAVPRSGARYLNASER